MSIDDFKAQLAAAHAELLKTSEDTS